MTIPRLGTVATNLSTATWKHAEYFEAGFRWCATCNIWYEPQPYPVICKECKAVCRSKVRTNKKLSYEQIKKNKLKRIMGARSGPYRERQRGLFLLGEKKSKS
jgi:hypothetical protein